MYLDIHTHSFYKKKDVLIVQNLFPEDLYQISAGNYYSIGLHPWNVKEKFHQGDVNKIKLYANNKNVIAIGEIGIDKKIKVPFDLQTETFEKQLEIAEQVNKPVIIHCVKAYNEILSYRKKSNQKIPWIIHWFNASREMAEELIEKNCYLSFGLTLFQTECKAYKAFQTMPLERVFFETDDAQYSIEKIHAQASIIRNSDEKVIQNKIIENFQSCFKITI